MNIFELLVILIVALLVVKPERLPEISYMLGRLIAKAQKIYQQIMFKANSSL